MFFQLNISPYYVNWKYMSSLSQKIITAIAKSKTEIMEI